MRNATLAAALCLLTTGAWAAPKAPVASCNHGKRGKCVEWRNLDARGTQAMKDLCATGKGESVWSEGKSCATANRIATCTVKVVDSVTVQSYYAPFTGEKAKAECALNPLAEFKLD